MRDFVKNILSSILDVWGWPVSAFGSVRLCLLELIIILYWQFFAVVLLIGLMFRYVILICKFFFLHVGFKMLTLKSVLTSKKLKLQNNTILNNADLKSGIKEPICNKT